MSIILMKALQLIVALLLLVVVHELGHYLFARIFGIKVNRFYLFFNPWFSLLKYYPEKGQLQVIAWTKKVDGKTEPRALLTLRAGKPHSPVNKHGRPSWAATMYGLGWLPLGGYCDIAGMVDETKGTDQLEAEPQPWEFRTKAAWKRLLVMVAGVMMNFVLAIVIYAGIALHWGDRVVPFDQAYEGMDYAAPMHDAGLRDGDILIAVNGKRADAKDASLQWAMVQPGARLTVVRGHTDTLDIEIPATVIDSIAALKTPLMTYRLPIVVDKLQGGMPAAEAGMEVGDRIVKVANDTTPSMAEFFAALDRHKGKLTQITVDRGGKAVICDTKITDGGKIGIQMRPADKIYPVEEVKYGLLASLPRGWELGTDQLATYVSSLRLVFTKEGAQQVGGFGTLGSLFPERWDWYTFWQITAFLSVILAFMNIIPIPGLDGGYLLFLLWEIVSGRKPSDRFLEIANTIGFGLLLLLLLYANGNDLIRALM